MASAWGSTFMTHSSLGVVRPIAQFSSCALLFLLLSQSALSQDVKSKTPQLPVKQAEVIEGTNDRIMELALANSVKQSDYVIGPGDLLAIEVFDVPDLT